MVGVLIECVKLERVKLKKQTDGEFVTANTKRQRRLRKRRKEVGLLDYRRAVTPEQAKALDELLEKMRLAQ